MMRRYAIGVAIAVMAAGGVAFGQGQGRVVKDPPVQFSFTVPVGSCFGGPDAGGFDVLSDVTFESHHGMTVYDRQGRVVKVLATWKFPRALNYNASDPTKFLWSGPGENQLTVDIYGYDADGNWGPVFSHSAGLPLKVVVPGHGPIQLETGYISWDRTDGGWQLLHNSGHNDLYEGNWQILCDYLR